MFTAGNNFFPQYPNGGEKGPSYGYNYNGYYYNQYYKSTQAGKEGDKKSTKTPASVFVYLDEVELRIKAEQKPDGSRQFPAKTCKDLQMCFPDSKTGNYWIDPNGGSKSDSFIAFCNFTLTSETCVYPTTTMIEKSKYVTEGVDGFRWFVEDISETDMISYKADATQFKNLRLSSDNVRQNVTYHCKNSYADKDEGGKPMTYFKLMTNTDEEVSTMASRRNRLDVISDDCYIKDGSWRKTVFEFSTRQTSKLPLIDVAVFDVADKDEEFGLEIGPVCFS